MDAGSQGSLAKLAMARQQEISAVVGKNGPVVRIHSCRRRQEPLIGSFQMEETVSPFPQGCGPFSQTMRLTTAYLS